MSRTKDLESPEHRAMEREMLRAARAEKPHKPYDHVAIAIVLFAIAAICYAVGYSGFGGLVLPGALTELGAYAFLLDGNRKMAKVDDR